MLKNKLLPFAYLSSSIKRLFDYVACLGIIDTFSNPQTKQ